MKRASFSLLLVSYLLCFTPLQQLTRLPLLLEHFEEHAAADPGLSFWMFLKIHYSGDVVVDEDYARDQRLPLRAADMYWGLISGVPHSVALQDLVWAAFRPDGCLTQDHERGVLEGWTGLVWHPPRG